MEQSDRDKGLVKLIQGVKIAHSFLHVMSELQLSAFLSSSISDRKRIFRNPLLKLEKWPLLSFSANHESWFEHIAELSSNDYGF